MYALIVRCTSWHFMYTLIVCCTSWHIKIVLIVTIIVVYWEWVPDSTASAEEQMAQRPQNGEKVAIGLPIKYLY